MATEVRNPSEPSVTSLLSGIVNDMQDLVKQQLQLTRREIEEDLRQTKEAASIFLYGNGFAFLGAIPLCLMLAHLLHWLASPPGSDLAWFPLWAGHAVVGFVLLAIGGGMIRVGREKMKMIHLERSPAAEALKENVQWLTTPK